MKYMICSKCGNKIAVTKNEHQFDIYDKSWSCNKCKEIWYSSDGWKIVGNLVIPYRNLGHD